MVTQANVAPNPPSWLRAMLPALQAIVAGSRDAA